MNTETMYTLGQITRCVFPDGAEPELTDVILVQPATGLARIMRSTTAKYASDDLQSLVDRLPADLTDPPGGVKAEDQGPFWLGYYQWQSAADKAQAYGPAELAEAGQALYGERWQTDLARDLGLSDGRRIRQWMSGDRPIPTGVWADITRLLRKRGLDALTLSSKLGT